MGRSFPLLALLLAACGSPDVEGHWVGDCDLNTGTTSSQITFDLELDPVEGDAITGVGVMIDGSYGTESPIGITGTMDGKNVELDMAYDFGLPSSLTGGTTSSGSTTTTGGFDDLFDISFGIDAKVKGDTMEGRCSMAVFGFGVGADIVLERQ